MMDWPVNIPLLRESPPGTIHFGYIADYYGDHSNIGRVIEFHHCNGTGVVGGPLDSRWTIQSIEPLTVTPSIWCKPPGGCGLHGWIKKGVWVPC
jgi:hypothetical protein